MRLFVKQPMAEDEKHLFDGYHADADGELDVSYWSLRRDALELERDRHQSARRAQEDLWRGAGKQKLGAASKPSALKTGGKKFTAEELAEDLLHGQDDPYAHHAAGKAEAGVLDADHELDSEDYMIWAQRDFDIVEILMVLKSGKVVGFMGEDLEDWAMVLQDELGDDECFTDHYVFNVDEFSDDKDGVLRGRSMQEV